MKNHTQFKSRFFLFVLIFVGILTSCTKATVADENADPIVGKWFLTRVNTTDVATIDCYRDSFIESDAETITFFLRDLLEDGSCETLINQTQNLTIEEGFYFLGDEALDIDIRGNRLSWRVDAESTLEFEK
jgi:hypothetical protein